MTDADPSFRSPEHPQRSHTGQAALQAEWAYLRAVIDTAPSLIFAKDWEGRFTLANRAIAEIYGTTPDKLLGKTDGDFNPNREQVEHFLRADRQVIETGTPLSIAEEPVTNPQSGGTRWFQTRKVLLLAPDGTRQVLGVSTDITEQKWAEAEVLKSRREAEELAEELQSQAAHLEEQAADLEIANDELSAAEGRLRAIINSSLDAIVTTDPNSIVTDWSHHAETIFGRPAIEAVGKSLSETIIPAHYREAHQKGIERYLATGEGPGGSTPHAYPGRTPLRCLTAPAVSIGTARLAAGRPACRALHPTAGFAGKYPYRNLLNGTGGAAAPGHPEPGPTTWQLQGTRVTQSDIAARALSKPLLLWTVNIAAYRNLTMVCTNLHASIPLEPPDL